MLLAAWDRSAANAVGTLQDAVSASVTRTAETINVLRLAAGVAPLVVTTKPGRKVASVSIAGKTLSDKPPLMEEWDTDRNEPIENLHANPGRARHPPSLALSEVPQPLAPGSRTGRPG